jgi:3-phosphoshikimate 1-carboxyvinyltransferase
MEGLAELRVKESDRLFAIARGLAACGVAVEAGEDWLAIQGAGGPPPGDGIISVAMDHRIAMAFLVLGCASGRPVAIDDAAAIGTSFPGFVALMTRLGADIRRP